MTTCQSQRICSGRQCTLQSQTGIVSRKPGVHTSSTHGVLQAGEATPQRAHQLPSEKNLWSLHTWRTSRFRTVRCVDWDSVPSKSATTDSHPIIFLFRPQSRHACYPDNPRGTTDGPFGCHVGCSDAHSVHVQCEYLVTAPEVQAIE